MTISLMADGINLASISIQILLMKIPTMFISWQMRRKFGPWLTKNYIFQQALRPHGTFILLTISLRFLFDGVSLTGVIRSQCLWNRMRNILHLCLIAERLLSNGPDSSNSKN